jgi:hypothetical protein
MWEYDIRIGAIKWHNRGLERFELFLLGPDSLINNTISLLTI